MQNTTEVLGTHRIVWIYDRYSFGNFEVNVCLKSGNVLPVAYHINDSKSCFTMLITDAEKPLSAFAYAYTK